MTELSKGVKANKCANTPKQSLLEARVLMIEWGTMKLTLKDLILSLTGFYSLDDTCSEFLLFEWWFVWVILDFQSISSKSMQFEKGVQDFTEKVLWTFICLKGKWLLTCFCHHFYDWQKRDMFGIT